MQPFARVIELRLEESFMMMHEPNWVLSIVPVDVTGCPVLVCVQRPRYLQ